MIGIGIGRLCHLVHIHWSTRARETDRLSKGKAIEEGITVDLEVHRSGEKRDRWSIYIDRSSAQEGGGARILLVRPGKEKFKYSIKFRFPVTNNMVEYETIGIKAS